MRDTDYIARLQRHLVNYKTSVSNTRTECKRMR